MGVGGQHHAPAALPPGKTRCPLYRRLGRPQGRSREVRKISPPPGFDPRTVQPVASRYTDCAIPAHVLPEKLIVFQLVKKFPAFYGTRRFCTVFTTAHHLSLSWTSAVQCTSPFHLLKHYFNVIYPSTPRSFSCFFLSGFPIKHYVHLCSAQYMLHGPPI